MLSRTSFLAGKQARSVFFVSRAVSSSCPTPASGSDPSSGQKWERPVRAEESGKVRLGFIPEEWFQAFYNKTGVTGPYVFGGALSTYLISKEIYVLEHEYYTGLSILLMIIIASKKLGPSISAYLDKEVDAIEKEWKDSRESTINDYNKAIADEKKEQHFAEGQNLLIAAKRENVALQLEAAFRERAMHVYQEVKRRLDYQVETQNIERRINQKHMVQWIVNNVMKSITPEQQAATLQRCIDDLGQLAVTAKK
ncbi:ATP synthase subunit b, mitochondrial [Chrysoperla carnea]|uniref:ATP synthase subunit b, mitochondrial n=1 Tax=Chrysoperla carnea TaxID=189513 RepID=UPI001D06F661|nr:ATP synthase subunit b, mitochondrial [Chrysoperla carnea]